MTCLHCLGHQSPTKPCVILVSSIALCTCVFSPFLSLTTLSFAVLFPFFASFQHPCHLNKLLSSSKAILCLANLVSCCLVDFFFCFLLLWLTKSGFFGLSRTPSITMNRLKGSENYQSWANSVTLWFTGNGCEDYLSSTETSFAEDQHSRWRKLYV